VFALSINAQLVALFGRMAALQFVAPLLSDLFQAQPLPLGVTVLTSVLMGAVDLGRRALRRDKPVKREQISIQSSR
jgi:hypothetical protein